MTLVAAVGQAQNPDGREAGMQAARQALDQMGQAPVALAFVVVSHLYPIQQVLAGISGLLGDTPLFGFSSSGSPAEMTPSPRSVTVALLGGEEVQARADWLPDFAEDSRACTRKMLQAFQTAPLEPGHLFVIADGISGDAAYLCAALSTTRWIISGCLADGDLGRGRTFQIGGRQAGSGGLAAALLQGQFAVGMGTGHGWEPAGAFAHITRVQGLWLRELDHRPPSEVYGSWFRYTAREWAYAPLSELVRLYPLGIQQEQGLQLRAPLRVEVDGSLRMNTILPEGKTAYLLVGNREACLQSARRAAKEALQNLGPGTRPVLAWVLVDAAWQSLLEVQPGSEFQAVREVLGEKVAVTGGYTLGQILRPRLREPVDLLNQHILVVLIGEPASES